MFIGSNCFFIIAGTPATIVLSGTSVVTTAPAAIVTFLPIVILGKIVAFAPTLLKSPIVTFPRILADGDISTKLPIWQSWVITAL